MHFDRLKRREFITLLGAAATAWPLAVQAQRQPTPVIGYLAAALPVLAAFREGLKEAGYAEGQNVAIEYRSANGQYDPLPALAAELVARRVDVIAASPTPAAQAAKAATTTIPIVFAVGADPVEAGLVESLNRPGGNLTGLSFFTFVLMKKRMELLHELVPQSALIGVLVNPANENVESDRKSAQEAALAIGWQSTFLRRARHARSTPPSRLLSESVRAPLCSAAISFSTVAAIKSRILLYGTPSPPSPLFESTLRPAGS
jgi:putative ABC transport system substrate-binding protein